jgi:hypothetical protein
VSEQLFLTPKFRNLVLLYMPLLFYSFETTVISLVLAHSSLVNIPFLCNEGRF